VEQQSLPDHGQEGFVASKAKETANFLR